MGSKRASFYTAAEPAGRAQSGQSSDLCPPVASVVEGPGGNGRWLSKAQVEDHVLFKIRATVMPAPLIEQARTLYRSLMVWRYVSGGCPLAYRRNSSIRASIC
jgi:hypothetical protein